MTLTLTLFLALTQGINIFNIEQQFTLDSLFCRNKLVKSPKPKELLECVGGGGDTGRGKRESFQTKVNKVPHAAAAI